MMFFEEMLDEMRFDMSSPDDEQPTYTRKAWGPITKDGERRIVCYCNSENRIVTAVDHFYENYWDYIPTQEDMLADDWVEI